MTTLLNLPKDDALAADKVRELPTSKIVSTIAAIEAVACVSAARSGLDASREHLAREGLYREHLLCSVELDRRFPLPGRGSSEDQAAAEPSTLPALSYAARGWAVLPLKPRAKVPLTDRGCLDATTDLDVIEAWWRRWPAANIGIATGGCSGLLVVDIDGELGEMALAELQERHGALPRVPEVRTGRGRHLYFAFDGRVRNRVKKLEQVDTFSTGGYVVAPPSIHPSGYIYRWAPGAAPRDRQIVGAPEWLIEVFV